MTKPNAETKLYQAVTKAALQGNKIRPGTFGSKDYNTMQGEVCLCGAVLAATGISAEEVTEKWDGNNIIKAVARKLGITLKQAASLNNGFEGESRTLQQVIGTDWYGKETKSPLSKGVDKYWFNIGSKLRKVYMDQQEA